MTDLSEFLRSRREQLRPADVGLPDSGRRRTPGLRREEVATLAGVSVDYLIRLEQGRDTKPSASIVLALADALRLNEDERLHLKQLATISAHRELCPAVTATAEVAPTVRALLDRLDPTPAFLLGPIKEVLAWNEAWSRLVAPMGMLDEQPPNLVRYTFLHPSARATYPAWDEIADEQVRQLRFSAPRLGAEPNFVALLDELGDQPEFTRRWSAYEVAPKRRGSKALRHPAAGLLLIDVELLTLEEDVDQRLVTWLPADDPTAEAMRPSARLRAV